MRTKTELSARPPAYTVAHEGTEAVIVFYTDVAENNERDDGTTYTAVSWMMKRPWSDGLEQRISASLDSWLRLAQQESYEESVLEIRAARDKLLADTDAEMCVDRLEIPIPDTVTATTMITAVKGFLPQSRM
jgi:hypothetical protein